MSQFPKGKGPTCSACKTRDPVARMLTGGTGATSRWAKVEDRRNDRRAVSLGRVGPDCREVVAVAPLLAAIDADVDARRWVVVDAGLELRRVGDVATGILRPHRKPMRALGEGSGLEDDVAGKPIGYQNIDFSLKNLPPFHIAGKFKRIFMGR